MDARDPLELKSRLSVDFPDAMLERLHARYIEPHRRYHTWDHVIACFDARDRLLDGALPEVDLALLFHDAVYQPLAGDNEARSAELLLDEGRRAWMNEGLLERACALVLATRHTAPEGEPDSLAACTVLDCDLSILGADDAVFDRYEAGVRQEFAAVDAPTFNAGRAHLLRSLLARPFLFATRRGQRLWEQRARENLERSLARL